MSRRTEVKSGLGVRDSEDSLELVLWVLGRGEVAERSVGGLAPREHLQNAWWQISEP